MSMQNIDKNLSDMRSEFGNHEKWITKFDLGYVWDNHETAEKYINEWFNKYVNHDVENLLEIAVGYGRTTRILIEKCRNLYGTDLNQCCIDYCKKTFPAASFKQTDGLTIPFDQIFDIITCFDSMVHFDKEVVEIYIKEIKRTLRNNGTCILHHAPSGETGVGWRSNMTTELMQEYCNKYELEIVDQFSWNLLPSKQHNDALSVIRHA